VSILCVRSSPLASFVTRPLERELRRLRAWKARPVPVVRPDATPMAQFRPACDGPVLTVRDRQMPVLRARGGHRRRGPTALQHGGDGHSSIGG
jgi:hypothetical protein